MDANTQQQAWQWLVENEKDVERLLRKLCHIRVDSVWDDVYSDVVVPRVADFYATFREGEGNYMDNAMLSWIIGGLRNVVRRYLHARNGARRKLVKFVVASENAEATGAAMDDASIAKFFREISATVEVELAREVMERLSEADRHFITFRAIGLTFVEMGNNLGRPESYARSHYYAAVENAKKIADQLRA